ncbi:MAG: response regulator [Methylocystis sp.]
MTNRLLIVDDDIVHRMLYSKIAAKLGFIVDVSSTLTEAAAALDRTEYGCIALDLMLGDHVGADVLNLVGKMATKPKVVIISGAKPRILEETLRLGRALDIDIAEPIQKPVNLADLRVALSKIAEQLETSAPTPPGTESEQVPRAASAAPAAPKLPEILDDSNWPDVAPARRAALRT